MIVRQVRQTERIRPGAIAERYLLREWGMCRWVWNQLVAESADAHLFNRAATQMGATSVPTFGYAEQDKFLTRLRRTTVDPATGERWLAAGSSVAQQQTVRDFAAARSKALKDRKDKVPVAQRRGLPRFKSRHTALPTLNYTRRGFSLRSHPETGRTALALPGGVLIPVVWSRDLPSEPKSVRVSRDSLGHWYASFVVEVEHEVLPAVAGNNAVGIDWGVTETATTVVVDQATGVVDEGTSLDLPHAQHGKSAAAKLARYQRMMARRATPRGKPSTRGYEHAKRLAAKAHKRVARQRQDDARKWARKVVAAHDQIAVEDFKPKFLAKSTMAKKAADGAIASAKAELIWQATKAGRDLRLVHPSNTTTDCSTCDARTKHRLPLGERVYACEACGTTRPRDKNSAAVMVVRAFGRGSVTIGDDEVAARAGQRPADIEGVSPAPAAVRAPAA